MLKHRFWARSKKLEQFKKTLKLNEQEPDFGLLNQIKHIQMRF